MRGCCDREAVAILSFGWKSVRLALCATHIVEQIQDYVDEEASSITGDDEA